MSSNKTKGDLFGKEQIVNAMLFTPKEKDVLNVILQDDKSYTLDEAKQLLETFLKTKLTK